MNNKIKLKIGEFSKLNRVTVKTLRHYENIGLLIPKEKDEWTGYRYYSVEQFKKMNTIIFLKKLGFSLEQIKEMFENGLDMPDQEMINQKIKSCEVEQKQLQWRYNELTTLAKQLHKKEEKMEKVFIKSLPARIFATHRRMISGYKEMFNLCPNIIGPEMKRLGCECPDPQYCFTVEHDTEYHPTDIDIEYFEAVSERKADSQLIKFKELEFVPTAVCMNHIGAYETMSKTFEKLLEYIEQNDYKITDNPRYCYIDGIWNKESENEWLTEIQIPVSR